MNIEFTPHAWEDFNYWIKYDLQKVQKIRVLIASIQSTPFKGIGNPEPLRHDLKGYWSRRIDAEHRLVYRIIGEEINQKVQVIQCRYHY
jgi:toxin YoeB